MTATLSGMDGSVRMRGLQYKNRAYLYNGRNAMRKFDGDNFYLSGIASTSFTPSVAQGAAGNLTGTYRYLVVPVNSKHFNPLGKVVAGFPSALSNEITVSAHKVTVGNIPATHADSQVDKWYVYRNLSGEYDAGTEREVQAFYLIGEVALGGTTFTDDVIDDAVTSTDLVRFNQQVPPTFKYGELYGERLFGCGFDPISTGTATVNADTTKIDFSGVSLPDGIVGCWFKVTDSNALYRITSRGSTTQITLDRAYVGALSGGTYTIFRYPWEVYFSDLEDVEAWGPAGEAFRWKRELPGRDHATGLIAFGGQLLVFSATKIYSINGKGPNAEDVRINPEPIFSGLGAISGDSIVSVENELYFMTLNGPARMQQGQAPELIGAALNTDWLDGLNAADHARICAGADSRSVWFAVPATTGDAENSRIFRLDRQTQTWWEEGFGHPFFYVNADGANGVQGKSYFAQGRLMIETDSGTTDIATQAYTGAVTSGGTTSFSTGTTLPTSGTGLLEAYVHIFRSGAYVGSRRITSNTSSSVSWASGGLGGGSLTVSTGDTFEIGNIWWTWKTKSYEVPAHAQRDQECHVTFGAKDANKSVSKTDYVDGSAIANSTQTLVCNELAKQFAVNMGGRDYAALIESRNGATVRQVVLGVNVRKADKQ